MVAKNTILTTYICQKNSSGLGFLLLPRDQSHSEQQRVLLSQPAGHYDSPERNRWISHEHATLETCTCQDSEQGRTALPGGRYGKGVNHSNPCRSRALPGHNCCFSHRSSSPSPTNWPLRPSRRTPKQEGVPAGLGLVLPSCRMA